MKNFSFKSYCCLLLFIVFTGSCAANTTKKPVEFFEDINLSDKQLTGEILLRDHKILDLQDKIQKLKNYNDKFKAQIDHDNSYNIDTSSLVRAVDKNTEIIAGFGLQISRLNREIRVLQRKI
jgi:hypothetical protein